ncbi:MAG: UTP--glucose-1-phosphate uridylyltransferase [Gammaproteobacteria bacterium]
MHKIKKAILPVAGFGTRFLPATKSIPKEMMPIIDTPLVEYAVREAIQAGVSEIIFITSPTKKAIEAHFNSNDALKALLMEAGKHNMIEKVFPKEFQDITFHYVDQIIQRGLGHAVLQAKHLIDEDEFFFVLLADDLILNSPNVCEQLANAHLETGCSILALNKVSAEETKKYGVISFKNNLDVAKNVKPLKSIIEKPQSNPPSQVAVTGRYLLKGNIFSYLENIEEGIHGELQLTDALNFAMQNQEYFGIEYEGIKFDCGSKEGFIKANLHVARMQNLIYE